MIDPKQVTIIIPTLCESPTMRVALAECRKSLYETMLEMRKIIVKNNNTNEFFNHDSPVREFNEDVVIIESKSGQCTAVNAAVAMTNTPWILVTNDDMVYPPGWWDKLTSPIFMESCVSPVLVEPRVGAPTFEHYFCGGAGGDFDRPKFYEYEKNRPQQQSPMRSGFNLPFLMRRELWDTIGGYDINYDPWGSNSDSDLEYKIRLAGVQPIQNQNCAVYHFSQTSGTFEPQNHHYWVKNWEYFKAKWGFYRTDDGIWTADFHMPTRDEGRIFFPEFENKYLKKEV